VTAATTLISGVHYVVLGFRHMAGTDAKG